MGAAGAGAEALANDASTSFALHNPAGMTRLKESQLMLGGGLVFSTIQFDPDPNTPIPGNDGGDAGGPAPLLAAFYSHSLTDDWKLGFNVFSLSAAVRLEKRTKTAVAHVRKHADRITRELAGTARRPAKRRTKRRRKK